MGFKAKHFVAAASLMLASCLNDCAACEGDCADMCYYSCDIDTESVVSEAQRDCLRSCGWTECGMTLDVTVSDAGITQDSSVEDADVYDSDVHDVGNHDTGVDASIPCGQLCAQMCGNDNTCVSSCLAAMCSGG